MKTSILATLALLAPFTLASVAAAPPTPQTNILTTRQEADVDDFTPAQLEAVVLLLDTIHSVPDDVLAAGQASADDWIVSQALPFTKITDPIFARSAAASTEVSISERDTTTSGLVETQGILQCLASIAWFLVEARVPIAKIRRAKDIIDALGGVRKAAEKLLKGKKNKSKLIAEGGAILWELFQLISGWGDVVENCS